MVANLRRHVSLIKLGGAKCLLRLTSRGRSSAHLLLFALDFSSCMPYAVSCLLSSFAAVLLACASIKATLKAPVAKAGKQPASKCAYCNHLAS